MGAIFDGFIQLHDYNLYHHARFCADANLEIIFVYLHTFAKDIPLQESLLCLVGFNRH